MIQIKIKLGDKNINLPQYKTEGASGFDIGAFLLQDIIIKPKETALIPTGLFFEIPTGYEIQIRSRSGLALNSGIIVLNSPGTIDSDYRGELKVILFNVSNEPFVVKNGDRIAQAILCKVEKCNFELCDNLSSTIRQDKGFGSTKV